MGQSYRILAVNPGSTSTKIALFEDDRETYKENILHSASELQGFNEVQDQLHYRKEIVERTLRDHGIPLENIDVFVGRGGGIVSCVGGTYEVNDLMVKHCGGGLLAQHPAQLGPQICKLFVEQYGGRAFTVNPPDTDELDEISRISGMKGFYRVSSLHALNQKEIALRYCAGAGKEYKKSNLIICHIGGGISVTAHRDGRMVDSNDILNGDGPFTPTRSGSLPTIKIVKIAYSGKYTEKELTEKLNKNGGLIDHLGTADAREVEKRIENGDEYAKLVYDAMIYQIGKYVGCCACTLKGHVDAIILTGGISASKYVVNKLSEYVSWIAPIHVLAGEFEMEALAAGALRVMQGKEESLVYTGVPVWDASKFDKYGK
jgi:butyrate kinase